MFSSLKLNFFWWIHKYISLMWTYDMESKSESKFECNTCIRISFGIIQPAITNPPRLFPKAI